MEKRRELDPTSPQLLGCCDFAEMLAYRHGGLDAGRRVAIFRHLNFEMCPYCRRLYEEAAAVGNENNLVSSGAPAAGAEERSPASPAVEDAAAARFARLRKRKLKIAPPPPAPGRLAAGQVWVCRPEVAAGREIGADPGYLYPVLVIDPGNGFRDRENLIRVVPLSVDSDFAWPGRSLRLGPENPLGYSCLVELFNERPMRAVDLGAYRGVLAPALWQACESEREAWFAGRFATPPAEVAAWEERELELTAALSAPVMADLWEDEEPAAFGDEWSEEEEKDEVAGADSATAVGDNVISLDFSGRPVELREYALAAADDEGGGTALVGHPLLSDGPFTVTLVEEDHGRLSIVVVAPPEAPREATLNGEAVVFKSSGPDRYRCQLSPAAAAAERLRFSFAAGDRIFTFLVPLSRGRKEESDVGE